MKIPEEELIFEKYLMPDVITDGFEKISPETVLDFGARILICDIDNTLVTYDDSIPTPAVTAWLKRMKDGGVTVAFLSNNHVERVEKFAAGTGLTAIADAHKPSVRGIDEILRRLEGKNTEAAFLGDQLLTDCLTGKRAGLPVFIVPPIKDKTSLFFRAKRLLEKPYLRKYRRIHGECGKNKCGGVTDSSRGGGKQND